MQSKEIVELIKTKKASAEADYRNKKDVNERLYILGELDAYQDLLMTIEQKEIKEATAAKADDQLETLIKFLALPKESQEKILKGATATAKKCIDFIKNELSGLLNNDKEAKTNGDENKNS